ncbi:MAG TPA: hypothetical protein EYP30_06775 [Archaeoglobaceae archaeon]|nr:hypothetical protein [Archaeoglobaceae archaeon]
MRPLILFTAFLILIVLAEPVSASSGIIMGKIIPFTVSYSPDTQLKDTSPSTRTFNVTTDRVAEFRWYFDNNFEKNDMNVSSSSFTKTAEEGTHNITVVVTSNGSISITWIWEVTAEQPQVSRRSGGGGGGGGMLLILPTPTPTPSPTPESASTSTLTLPSYTPTPTPTQSPPPQAETETPVPTQSPVSETAPPVTMDFSYGTEFFKWFRSVLMVSSSFVLAYFGKNY